MKNEYFQAGDVVCFLTSTDLFSQLQNAVDGKVGHVGIVYDVVMHKGKLQVRILEEVADGLRQGIYDVVNSPSLAVLRHTADIDVLKMQQVIWKAYTESYIKGNNKYSYIGLIDASLNALMELITFGSWDKHRILPSDENWFCSEFVAYCYEQYGKKILAENNETISPTDIYDSGEFIIIKPFGV